MNTEHVHDVEHEATDGHQHAGMVICPVCGHAQAPGPHKCEKCGHAPMPESK